MPGEVYNETREHADSSGAKAVMPAIDHAQRPADQRGQKSTNVYADIIDVERPAAPWIVTLVEIAGRKVGFTRESGINDSTLGVSWTKLNQNTAFYGTFTTTK